MYRPSVGNAFLVIIAIAAGSLGIGWIQRQDWASLKETVKQLFYSTTPQLSDTNAANPEPVILPVFEPTRVVEIQAIQVFDNLEEDWIGKKDLRNNFLTFPSFFPGWIWSPYSDKEGYDGIQVGVIKPESSTGFVIACSSNGECLVETANETLLSTGEGGCPPCVFDIQVEGEDLVRIRVRDKQTLRVASKFLWEAYHP